MPTTKYDESYNSVELTEDEKTAAKATITAALDKVKAGEEFSAIKEADDKLTTSTLDFVLDDGTAEEAYQDAAVALEKDAFTKDIVETDTGFYIIKMVDNNASDAYDKAVTEAISQAEQDAFDAEYENIKKEYTIEVNSKVWDPIVIGKTTIIETATSDDTGNGTTDTTPATGEDTQDTTTGE